MKIKIKFFLLGVLSTICLIFIVFIGIYGIRNLGYNHSSKQEENDTKDFTYKKTLAGIPDDEIVFFDNRRNLLTANKSMYQFSFDEIYSGDTNFKLIDQDANANGIYFGDLINFNDKNNYDYYRIGKIPYLNTCKYFIYNYSSIQYCITNDAKLRIHYLLNSDTFAKNDFDEPRELEISNLDLIKDEKVLALYDDTYLKTDKNFYNLIEKKIISNEEECNKYIDVECKVQSIQFEIEKNELLSSMYDDIKFVIITDREYNIINIILKDGRLLEYKFD